MARRSKFQAPKNVEREYEQTLKKIARLSAGIIDPHIDGAQLINARAMMEQHNRYAQLLEPMAQRVALRMLLGVSKNNARAFTNTSKEIGRELRESLAASKVGITTQQLQREQVTLITSLPIEAGERAQRLALSAVTSGKRPDEVAQELLRTEEITVNRARHVTLDTRGTVVCTS